VAGRVPSSSFQSPKDGEPPLHRAARVGDHEAIRSLVAAGVPVDDRFNIRLDPKAREQLATPLMMAVGSADGASAETVELLVTLGASPRGALAYATGLGWNSPPGGDAARLAVLLRAGSDPNEANALAAVARTGDVERLRLLLDAGATPSRVGRPTFTSESPTHQAAASGSLECVRLLLDAGAEPDPPMADGYDEPVLTLAASVEIFAVLLGAGARVETVLPHDRSILREVAARRIISVSDRVEMLRLLQAACVDVNRQDSFGATVLGSLAMVGDAEGIEALLAVGADPRIGRNPLGSACFSYSSKRDPSMERTIALLVSAGIDKDGADERGFRPIHAAVSDDRFGPDLEESDGISIAAIAALIELGADVDAPFPDNGWRPVDAAADQGRTAAVRLFLDAGIDPKARTPDGSTALDLARAAVHEFSAPVDRDEAAEERMMNLYTERFGRARAIAMLARLEDASQADHAARLTDARECVTLLESI
jgi:ankyrin repeat protein